MRGNCEIVVKRVRLGSISGYIAVRFVEIVVGQQEILENVDREEYSSGRI